MAVVRVKLNQLASKISELTIDKYKQSIKDAESKWVNQAMQFLKEEIVTMIKSGQSPVKGGGNQTGGMSRFYQYSPSYTQQIQTSRYLRAYGKRVRPINLYVTGKMLNSIKSRQTTDGFSVWFSSEIAKYHNDLGAGKSRIIRRMLPSNKGEEFTRAIWVNITNLYEQLLKNELRK